MTTYAIGDIHGCLSELKALLNLINFNQDKDTLWLTGDLVNVGPDSLETLRFIYENRHCITCVLGNHDLALLGIDNGAIEAPTQQASCQALLDAPDKPQLLDWLAQQPLAHYDSEWDILLTHAGLYPDWSIEQVLSLSQEPHLAMQGINRHIFYENLFGNEPSRWSDTLTGSERLRFIVNATTRMRYLTNETELELTCKKSVNDAPKSLYPWYEHPAIKHASTRFIFGHWSALEGKTSTHQAMAIDTGCVWGKGLTALRLPDGKRFSVPSKCYSTY